MASHVFRYTKSVPENVGAQLFDTDAGHWARRCTIKSTFLKSYEHYFVTEPFVSLLPSTTTSVSDLPSGGILRTRAIF